MTAPLRLYLAGPYWADTPEGIDRNIEAARTLAAALWNMGHDVYCPHMNTAQFDRLTEVPEERYREFGLWMVQHFDAVVCLPRWRESKGTLGEIAEAHRLGKTVYYSLEDVPDAS